MFNVNTMRLTHMPPNNTLIVSTELSVHTYKHFRFRTTLTINLALRTLLVVEIVDTRARYEYV